MPTEAPARDACHRWEYVYEVEEVLGLRPSGSGAVSNAHGHTLR